MTTAVEFLQVDPTTRCNYSCVYCRGRRLPPADIDPALFRAALYLFPGARYLELHGEGEPLLSPVFFALAGEARARNIILSVFTNGSQFTDRNIAALLDAEFHKVVISIDSADPETFRKIRGGRLEQVVDGITRLLRRRQECGKTAPAIGISATLQRQTLAGIQGLVALYQSLGLDGGLDYQGLNPMAEYARHYPPDLAGQDVPLTELDRHFARLRADPLLCASVTGTSAHRGFYDELFQPLARGERFCPWLKSGAYVTVRGFVTPCCMIGESGAYGRVDCFAADRCRQEKAAMQDMLAGGAIPAACRGCELARIIVASPQGNKARPDRAGQ